MALASHSGSTLPSNVNSLAAASARLVVARYRCEHRLPESTRLPWPTLERVVGWRVAVGWAVGGWRRQGWVSREQ